MRIELRNDSVIIDGYVNAVGRDSKPITESMGKFVEMIEPGTFNKALKRAKNVDLLLNHDPTHKLGSTKDGNLKLIEDSIGLRANCVITDSEVIAKAREGKLRGWSFGMIINASDFEQRSENIPRRHVCDIDLLEVSIIDDRKTPCYAGTSVECRADADILTETRSFEFEQIPIIDNTKFDYSAFEQRIQNLNKNKED